LGFLKFTEKFQSSAQLGFSGFEWQNLVLGPSNLTLTFQPTHLQRWKILNIPP